MNHYSTFAFLFIENTIDDSENATPDMSKLRHPRSGLPAMFLFSSDNSSVQEVLAYQEKKGSWFVNDSVQEDGKMHISTPMDPVLLVLPYLKRSKQEGRVLPLDDLLVDPEYPDTQRLAKCVALKYISSIADRKGKLNCHGPSKDQKWKVLKLVYSVPNKSLTTTKKKFFAITMNSPQTLT